MRQSVSLLMVAVPMVVSCLSPPSLRAQSVFYDCPTPTASQVQVPSFMGLSGLSATKKESNRQCTLLTEKGPRAVSLYQWCPTVTCHKNIELAGIGVVAATEQRLRNKMSACVSMGTNCDPYFAVAGQTGFTTVDPERRTVKGWHRINLHFLGIKLPLPVQEFGAARLDGPAELSTQYGVPFHQMKWHWDENEIQFGINNFDVSGVGRLDVSVKSKLTSDRSEADRTAFYSDILAEAPVQWPDWAWYLSPSTRWETLDLKNAFDLDFDFAPSATTVNLGFGSASLSAFVHGSIEARYRHLEGQEKGAMRSASPPLPTDTWYQTAYLNTTGSETVAPSLTGGIRVRIRSPWFSWREEWALPPLSTSNTSPASTRSTAEFEYLAGKPASPIQPVACTGSGPAAKPPLWLVATLASSVPPPDDPSPGSFTRFARDVGQVVADSLAVCPVRFSSSELTTVDAIRTTYQADIRRFGIATARSRACSSLTQILRPKLMLCERVKGVPQPAGTRYRRGRVECDILV